MRLFRLITFVEGGRAALEMAGIYSIVTSVLYVIIVERGVSLRSSSKIAALVFSRPFHWSIENLLDAANFRPLHDVINKFPLMPGANMNIAVFNTVTSKDI